MKIVYSKPGGISLRDIIETKFYILEIEDEELMFEYLHFKLLQSWNL